MYTDWLEGYDGLPYDYKGIVELEKFIHNMINLSSSGSLELWEFPSFNLNTSEVVPDYFEREDNNFVIPRECFTVD